MKTNVPQFYRTSPDAGVGAVRLRAEHVREGEKGDKTKKGQISVFKTKDGEAESGQP